MARSPASSWPLTGDTSKLYMTRRRFYAGCLFRRLQYLLESQMVLQLFCSFRDNLTASKKKCFIQNPKHRRWKETCVGTVSIVTWYVIMGGGLSYDCISNIFSIIKPQVPVW